MSVIEEAPVEQTLDEKRSEVDPMESNDNTNLKKKEGSQQEIPAE